MENKEQKYKELLFDDYKLLMKISKRYHDLAIKFPKGLSSKFQELKNKTEDKIYAQDFIENYHSIYQEVVSLLDDIAEELEVFQQIHFEINKDKINSFHEDFHKHNDNDYLI